MRIPTDVWIALLATCKEQTGMGSVARLCLGPTTAATMPAAAGVPPIQWHLRMCFAVR